MVGARANPVPVFVKFVVVLGPTKGHAREATPVFEAFDSIYAEHCLAELRMEFVENWLPQSGGRVPDHTSHHASDGVTVEPYLVDQVDHFVGGFLVCAPDDVIVVPRKIKRLVGRGDDVADTGDVSVDGHAKRPQVELRNGAGCDTCRRFTGRTPPAAAVVADSILYLVSVVGVGGAERLCNMAVIPAALIL